MRRISLLSIAAPVLLGLGACSPQTIHQQVSAVLPVTSSTIVGGSIPTSSTCKGASRSPQLAWADPPQGTRSLALIMEDHDKIVGHLHRHYLVHWLVFNMPADKRSLAEGQSAQLLPDGTIPGNADTGAFGYTGPCPDAGSTHHYAFTVYALDVKLGLGADAKGRQLLQAIDGHILAKGQLIGTFSN